MNSLRSIFLGPLKRGLARTGRIIIPLQQYGVDPFRDIQRLSSLWGLDIRVFLDIGANRGQTTRAALEAFPCCRVIACEPDPTAFQILSDGYADNEKVELIDSALAAEAGDRVMYDYGDGSSINSLVPNAQFTVRFNNRESKRLNVSCTTIDRLCSDRGIEKIDVLKIDTEGFDLEVLKGATSMLSRRAVNFIYFEFNDISDRDGASGGALAPVDHVLRQFGYRFIASYNDYIVPTGELFLVANALYALPPAAE